MTGKDGEMEKEIFFFKKEILGLLVLVVGAGPG